MFNFISKLSLGAALGMLLYVWSAPEVIPICAILLGVSLLTHVMIED